MVILTHFSVSRETDGVYMNPRDGMFVSDLCSRFDGVLVCAASVARGESAATFRLPPSVVVVPLSSKRGLWRLLSIGDTVRTLRCLASAQHVHLFSGLPQLKSAVLNVLTYRVPMTLCEQGQWTDRHSMEPSLGPLTRVLLPLTCGVLNLLRRWVIREAKAVFVHGSVLEAECRGLNPRVFEAVPLTPLRFIDLCARHDRPNCGATEPRILYVGAVGKKKGVEFLIDACRLLAEAGEAFRLELVLLAPLTGQQQEQLASIRQRTRIQLSLEWPALRELYRSCDLLVVPSINEGFPRVLYEGMSQSIPIVTTRLAPISAVLRHEEHALLCEPRDATALASNIKRMLHSRELMDRLSDSAFELLEQRMRSHAGKTHADQVFEAACETRLGMRPAQ